MAGQKGGVVRPTHIDVFRALEDLSEAAAPFVEPREHNRYERARLASTYQQARLLVRGASVAPGTKGGMSCRMIVICPGR